MDFASMQNNDEIWTSLQIRDMGGDLQRYGVTVLREAL